MRSLVTVLIVSGFFATHASADELYFEVPAHYSWTETGLYVHAGDWLELKASGVIVWGGRGERSDPAGSHGGGFFRPLNDAGVGALIGDVGGFNFYIGRRASIQAPASGELRLGINDDKFGDNRGSYRVNVRTRHGGSRRLDWTGRTYDEPAYRRSSSRGQEYVWWRGRVDGSDYLVIRGDSLSVRHLDKLPIQHQDYDFSGRLPARRTRLHLNVIRARGRVELVERPDDSNDYTAVILIDDNDELGAYDYELELIWERPRRYRGDRGGRVNRDFAEAFRWKGRVDNAFAGGAGLTPKPSRARRRGAGPDTGSVEPIYGRRAHSGSQVG